MSSVCSWSAALAQCSSWLPAPAVGLQPILHRSPGTQQNHCSWMAFATDSRKVSGHASKILASNCWLSVAPTMKTLVYLSKPSELHLLVLFIWNTLQDSYTEITSGHWFVRLIWLYFIHIFSIEVFYFPVIGKNCKYINHMPINIMQIIVLQCIYCIYFTRYYI